MGLLLGFLIFLIGFRYYFEEKIYYTVHDFKEDYLDSNINNQNAIYIIGSSRMRGIGINDGNIKKTNKIVNMAINSSSLLKNFFITLYILENLKPKAILFEVGIFNGFDYRRGLTDLKKRLLLTDVFGFTTFKSSDYFSIFNDYLSQPGTLFKNDTYLIPMNDFFHSLYFTTIKNQKNFFIKNYKTPLTQIQMNSQLEETSFNKIHRLNRMMLPESLETYPIEYFFIKYLNKVAKQKKIEIKYIIPLTFNTMELNLYPYALYKQNIPNIHHYKDSFFNSIYKKENFRDENHLNKKGIILFEKEVLAPLLD